MPPEAVEPVEVFVRSVRRPAPLISRLVFSFPVAISSLLLVLLVFTVRNRFNDPDMWWHLKTGEIIWNTRHLPTVDTFSYTANGRPWTLQEWLSQVTIFAAYHFGGYGGMMLWLCTFGSSILIGGYALCCVYSGNAKVAFLGALTIWLFSTVGLSIRPHLIGYVLLIFELLVVEWGYARNRRWFYALPPLLCIWINVHSSFFFGLVVLGIVFTCSLFEFRLGQLVSHRWEEKKRNALIVAGLFSIGALFLNPIGPGLIVYPLDVMFHQKLNLTAVSEWQQPDFSDPRSLSFLLISAVILFIPVLRPVDIHLRELILLIMGVYLALHHERMLFVFGILAAPVLCRLLAGAWDNYHLANDRIAPNALIIAISLVISLVAFPADSALGRQVVQSNPVEALQFLSRSGLKGNLLNEYVNGGFLIWAAPGRKVFIDGRADIYDPAGTMAEYGRWLALQTDSSTFLSSHDIQLCLLARDSPAARLMSRLEGWRRVYSDESYFVLAKTRI